MLFVESPVDRMHSVQFDAAVHGSLCTRGDRITIPTDEPVHLGVLRFGGHEWWSAYNVGELLDAPLCGWVGE
jgi:hypothetical protein